MIIHNEFHSLLLKIHPKLKEDIQRGVGTEEEIPAALSFLEKIEGIVKELTRIKFEFDVDDQIQVDADILRMEVSIIETKKVISSGTEDEHEMAKAFIFIDELFRLKSELLNWSKQFKTKQD